MNSLRSFLCLLTIVLCLAASSISAQTVSSITDLTTAITAANAAPSTPATINLAAGTYSLTTNLPALAANNLKLQGPTTGSPAILDATGLASGVIFNITADQVVIANLTFRNARTHAIAIQPGADNGRIENCTFTNPTAPQPATAAIDGNGCAGWTVTGNSISAIVGTTATAEPAIHFYGGASGTTVTNNLIQNCDRAIALGGDPAPVAPAITTQPASLAVKVGQTATFTVVATGTPAPTYQWLKNGNSINGATSATYTTPATTTADHAATFTVVVTNSVKSVTSSNATLTVIPATTITHGSQLNATNTGVPSGHILTDVSSTIIVTEAWISGANGGTRIIEHKHFLSGAQLIVTVDGFTVQYCKFSGYGGLTTDANDGQSRIGKNVTITDCEFDGNHENLRDSVAIGGSHLTLKRVHIHRWPRAMWVGEGNIWVEECYMHDLTEDASGAHIENIYVAGGPNQTYIRNKLISNRVRINGGSGISISASLAIYNESWAVFPELDHILIENNYFESDGGYALYAGACVGKLPAPYAKNTVARGNIFGRGTQRKCGYYGPVTAFDPDQSGNIWTDNTWGPRGPYWQSGDPEEGAAIAAPGPS